MKLCYYMSSAIDLPETLISSKYLYIGITEFCFEWFHEQPALIVHQGQLIGPNRGREGGRFGSGIVYFRRGGCGGDSIREFGQGIFGGGRRDNLKDIKKQELVKYEVLLQMRRLDTQETNA